VERVVEELRPTLEAQGIELHSRLFRPATFIQTAIRNVKSSLVIGALLVVAVLPLFLFNLRTAAISCTAIPPSLLAAITVLQHLGITINTITLGKPAIAIGEVVDDVIIDVENILRRLRENRRSKTSRSPLSVVFDASMEVRGAVVYATFAVILVFIPVLTLSGVGGRSFSSLAVSYILAIVSSRAVALTVTPAMCLILLGNWAMPEREPPLIHWLKKKYGSLLDRVEGHSLAAISILLLLIGAGLSITPAPALHYDKFKGKDQLQEEI